MAWVRVVLVHVCLLSVDSYVIGVYVFYAAERYTIAIIAILKGIRVYPRCCLLLLAREERERASERMVSKVHVTLVLGLFARTSLMHLDSAPQFVPSPGGGGGIAWHSVAWHGMGMGMGMA